MYRQHIGTAILAFATLLLELSMIRAFDVILDPVMGYMVITIAMFALGLGGIYVYLFKAARINAAKALPLLTLAYALSTVLVLPILNALPFDLNFSGNILVQLAAWIGMYCTIVVPFFLSGIILSLVFSLHANAIASLYCADLSGAGLACLLLMVLIPIFGPGGMLFFLAGLLCLAAAFFSTLSARRCLLFLPAAVVLIAWPFVHGQYIEFADHANKRNTEAMKSRGLREYVKWDPVSKVEVYAESETFKHFALDGGQQSSWMVRFDGDFATLKREIDEYPLSFYFGVKSLAYFLKRGTPVDALILGAAVGDEPCAALVFGAHEVDAIEMVGAMVRAAKGRYAAFSGNLFNHPQVHYRTGEARTFLRATAKQYDIIQMFSNHSSSSIAQGNGALEAVYLQTVEAYLEYFSHLKPNGILSMNRHFYPRMLTTAALAWHRLGKADFPRHVLVLEYNTPNTLPAVLIKMTPWTATEVQESLDYLNRAPLKWERTPAMPSPLITRQHPYESAFRCGEQSISELSLLFGTYGQKSLPYPITVRFSVDGSEQSAEFQLDGRHVRDNAMVRFPLDAPWQDVWGKQIRVSVRTENDAPEQGFSVWQNPGRRPVTTLRPLSEELFSIAFNPLDLEHNQVPAALLAQPFPKTLAAQADFRLDPVVDNQPFFNMVRKTTRALTVGQSPFLDSGTAQVLNAQLLPVLSKDIVGFFVVGSVSVLFAALFIFLPLHRTKRGEKSWPAMSWFLLYFSCLGAGFIMIELTLIQLCTRLIGHPAYTYAAVLFALLVSAAIGSFISKKMLASHPGRWPWIFVALVLYGAIFLACHQDVFTHLLQYTLPLRWIAATLVIFPLGLFMGMPFPLGIATLGRIYSGGIAWAWGMNGFFTVLGGFLSLVCAFFLGFKMTVMIALGIYCLALIAYAVIAGIDARQQS